MEGAGMKPTMLWTLLMTGVVLLSGCATESSYRVRPQERVIPCDDPDEVLVVAGRILQREFGRVAARDTRRLVTAPAEYTTERESGTMRDLYRGRSTMRRIATFEVGRRADRTVARLRIDVERQDTQRQEVMHPTGHRLSDTPGSATPITQDAATTEAQNTVWTRVRRDTRLERALLEELQEYFSRLNDDDETPGTRDAPSADESSAAAP
jgi:hypothetical protein